MIIVGDIHGKVEEYAAITSRCNSSFQLGDFGFQKAYNAASYLVDTTKHKMGQGNHDDHDFIAEYPGFVGRYANLARFFWIGGGYSIDQSVRRLRHQQGHAKTWWSNEELSFPEMMECAALYRAIQPNVVISHECPSFICREVSPDTSILTKYGLADNWHSQTSWFLTHLFNIHSPSLWIFGHHHHSCEIKVGGTTFRCLGELDTFDLG